MQICVTPSIIMGPRLLRGAFPLISPRLRAIDGGARGVVGLPVRARRVLNPGGVSFTPHQGVAQVKWLPRESLWDFSHIPSREKFKPELIFSLISGIKKKKKKNQANVI